MMLVMVTSPIVSCFIFLSRASAFYLSRRVAAIGQ
jgi:hypothetical protein